MSVFAMYFSPTGGTKRVLDALTAAWNMPVTAIDLLPQDAALPALTRGDVCLIAVPSFAGRVPVPATETLGRMAANGARAVPIVVYGNRAYDDTLVEMQDVLTAAGFRLAGAVAAIAEHSIFRQFAAGRPDADDLANLAAAAARLQQALAADADGVLTLPGNRPYRPLPHMPYHPVVSADCMKCGTCAAACPVGAISPESPDKTDPDKCITCMRCVSLCPAHARYIEAPYLAAGAQKLGPVCAVRKKVELYLPVTEG